MAKKKTKIDPKINKANLLRKEANKTSLESIKVTEKWCNEKPGTKKYNELSKKSDKADAKADEAYEKYYEYVHKNFTGDSINKSMEKVTKDKNNKKKFFSFSFLKGLERK